jgi:RHS repeat-associated protein
MRCRKRAAWFILGLAITHRLWAYNIPPFATDHEAFLAMQGNTHTMPGPSSCHPMGSPIDVATGNFFQTIPVLTLSGRGPVITISLTYHSFDLRKGQFGLGWTSSYDQRIIKTTDGAEITAVCANSAGRRDRYIRNPDGSYLSPPNLRTVLSENADGSFVLREKNGIIETFASNGSLISITDRNGNALSLAYDSAGFLMTIVDASGRNVILTKGADGRVASVTDPASRQFSFLYDADGNLTSITDPLGNSTTLQYDSNNHLAALADPKKNTLLHASYNADGTVASYTERGETWTVAYNPSASTTSETDSNGNRWTYVYNSVGSITQTIDPAGNTTLRVYDANFNPVQYTDQNGHTTVTSYDLNGNPLTVTDALGATVTATYDPVLNVPLTVKDRVGNVTSFAYDSHGNMTTIVDASGNVRQYRYNSAGQLIALVDAAGNSTSISYDNNGNPTKWVDPLGNSASAVYDILGNAVTTSDANGKTTQFSYDADLRLTQSVDSTGGTVLYQYDQSGNLTSLTTPNTGSVLYQYDSLNRVTQVTNPVGRLSTYTYDKKDNVSSKTDANGIRTSYSYDRVERLLTKTGSDTVSYVYDKAGQVSTLTNSATALSFVYDAANRLIQARTSTSGVQPNTTIAYTYDANGQRRTRTDPSGDVTNYTFDALSRLTSLQAPSGETYTFTYDNLSHRTGLVGPLGRSVAYSWDAAGRLVSIADQASTGNVIFSYTRDRVGNILSSVGNTGSTIYNYDPLSRLIAATHSGAQPAESYVYDAMDNRVGSAGGFTYSYDLANRLAADSTYNYSYDGNGNLIRKTERASGRATVYTYDSDNRLTGVTTPQGLAATYRYDGLGRRISKTIGGLTTAYIYDGSDIVAEYSGGNLAATYLHGPGVDEVLSAKRSGTTFYLQRDALGSVVQTFSAAGVSSSYQYDSYGKITAQTGSTPTSFAYTGREYDVESGLYYYRARYYDPGVGRFISEDPVAFRAGKNFYSYVGANPINRTDPSGACIEDACILEGLYVAAYTCASNPACVQAVIGIGVFIGSFFSQEIRDTAPALIGMPVLGELTVVGEECELLAGRARDIHNVLDPIAQEMRTTAVLSTEEGVNIVAGGARDLTPAQRAVLAPGEVAARLPGEHAEITALQHAADNGLTPGAIGVTRPICPSCQAAIEGSGGKLTSPTTAKWPKQQ